MRMINVEMLARQRCKTSSDPLAAAAFQNWLQLTLQRKRLILIGTLCPCHVPRVCLGLLVPSAGVDAQSPSDTDLLASQRHSSASGRCLSFAPSASTLGTSPCSSAGSPALNQARMSYSCPRARLVNTPTFSPLLPPDPTRSRATALQVARTVPVQMTVTSTRNGQIFQGLSGRFPKRTKRRRRQLTLSGP